MDLRSILGDEFRSRQRRNPRYSLRAFALSLGTHHGTLSRIIHGRRRVTQRTIRRIGARLLRPEQVVEACMAEDCDAIVRLVRTPSFRPDTRWIAVTAGIPLDAVNVALQRLLHDRRLVMASRVQWCGA